MKRMILFSVMLFMISCSPEMRGTDTIPGSVNKTIILQLVNGVRKTGCQCGDTWYKPVAPLSWNNQLEKAAIAHSTDMFEKKYFGHTAPDGSNAGVRIERAGYNWKAFGENIAEGQRTEEEVVKSWLQSPGHCKNIMNKDYQEMGVGRKEGLWTQTFGAR